MCLSFVYYYPKIDLVYCVTSPALVTLLRYFGITRYKWAMLFFRKIYECIMHLFPKVICSWSYTCVNYTARQCFSTFLLQRNLPQCLHCSWNPMQWSKCLSFCNKPVKQWYGYNCTVLWLRIPSQAISVCFGRTPDSHSRKPEVPRNPCWKTLL